MGAWIETHKTNNLMGNYFMLVAPLMGAWIETHTFNVQILTTESLPSWGRGLKLCQPVTLSPFALSLPSWGRGLTLPLEKTCLLCPSRSPHGGVD